MATPRVLHTLARFSCSTCTDDVPLARTCTSAPYVAASDLPAVGVEGLIPTGKKKKKSKGKGDATGPEYGLQGRINARLVTLDEQHRCGQLCCWSVTHQQCLASAQHSVGVAAAIGEPALCTLPNSAKSLCKSAWVYSTASGCYVCRSGSARSSFLLESTSQRHFTTACAPAALQGPLATTPHIMLASEVFVDICFLLLLFLLALLCPAGPSCSTPLQCLLMSLWITMTRTQPG